MQALRSTALTKGSLLVVRGGSRGSKGLGWYQRYQKLGPDGFRKAKLPTPFDWEAEQVRAPQPTGGRRRRRRAFFDISIDSVPAGRVEFELAADLLPVTCENFLRLCEGVFTPVPPRARMYLGRNQDDESKSELEKAERILCYEGTKVGPASVMIWPWVCEVMGIRMSENRRISQRSSLELTTQKALVYCYWYPGIELYPPIL